MTFTPPGAPSCYGKSWSPTETECKGGLDPAYISPANGSHVREKCRWYTACANTSSTAQIIPSTSLYRPPAPNAIPIAPVQVATVGPPRPVIAQYPYRTPGPITQAIQQGFAPPHLAGLGPQQVPVAYQAPGAQMPSYLAVPEPVDGSHWFTRLMREVFRSAVKGAAHTVASSVDHTPINPYRDPTQ